MFSLVRMLGIQVALKQEAVPFAIAFLIAEFFYKFKSFTLECFAFLVTWFVLSFVQSLIFGARDRTKGAGSLGISEGGVKKVRT